jgi:hypothetical protein
MSKSTKAYPLSRLIKKLRTYEEVVNRAVAASVYDDPFAPNFYAVGYTGPTQGPVRLSFEVGCAINDTIWHVEEFFRHVAPAPLSADAPDWAIWEDLRSKIGVAEELLDHHTFESGGEAIKLTVECAQEVLLSALGNAADCLSAILRAHGTPETA